MALLLHFLTSLRRLGRVRGPWLGLGLGAALFAAEAAGILRSGAMGLSVDVEGPAAAMLAAIRPALPGLLARIALVYLGGGALLGVGAELLARFVEAPPRWRLVAAELAALLLWDVAWHALHRPALVDDLPFGQGLLAALVARGSPGLLGGIAALWLGAHAALALRRARPGALKVAAGLGALVLVSGLSLRWTHPPRRGQGRLVVLFGIDAFRPDRLGGQRQVAPNLEALLGEATLFTRAYTPIAQTEPAWRALLTARWPHRTGVRYPLTAEARWEELPTFSAAFDRAGYATAFFTDCSRFNYQGARSGFALRVQPPRGALNFALEKFRFRGVGLFADNRIGAWLVPELVDNRALAGIHDPMGFADRLGARMAELGAGGPALVAFHATAAHFPGDPVYPFYRRYVDPSEPLARRLRMFFSPISAGGAGAPGPGAWSRGSAEALYDELLAQADAQLGRVLDALRAEGLYDEATVVVFSDHGESFHADHPELAGATPVHGARLSEEENRILLAVKLPGGRGAKAPARSDALVRLVDVGPTLLELAGLPPLPGADGESFAKALRGEPLAPRLLYAETGFSHASPDAFDPEHAAGAPRSFEAYRLRPDGVVETAPAAHEAILAEKDVGAFDGETWIIRAPRKVGPPRQRCAGACEADEARLSAWLDGQLAR